jgi:hypothetical protein
MSEATDHDHVHGGGCHCGNISLTFESAREPAAFEVRACQCRFCRKHNTRSVSDPEGRVVIEVARPSDLQRYLFGLRTAEYLLCRTCGVYVAAVVDLDLHPRALVIVNALDDAARFTADPAVTNYDGEDEPARLARRRAAWTPATLKLDD